MNDSAKRYEQTIRQPPTRPRRGNTFQRELQAIGERIETSAEHQDRASKKTVLDLVIVTERMAGYIDLLEGELNELREHLRDI